MTPFKRFQRRLSVRFSRTAANDHLIATGEYGLGARKVSAAVDTLIRAMNNVLVAVLIERAGAAPGRDLRAIVAHEVTRASLAAAAGMKAFRGLADPADIYLDARQLRAAVSAKAGLGKLVDAAGTLLLACESPPQDDLDSWLVSFVGHTRELLDARIAALASALVGAKRNNPGTHLGQCLLSVAVLDRLAFDLLLGRLVSEVDARELRERFADEAGRALAAIDVGAKTIPKARRKLESAARFGGDMTKPLGVLEKLEASFNVERGIVIAYASLIDVSASLQAILERAAVLQSLLEERSRLADARQRLLAA